jgi:hypothetical protein
VAAEGEMNTPRHNNTLVGSYLFKFAQETFLPHESLDEVHSPRDRYDDGTPKRLPADLAKTLFTIVFFVSKLSGRPAETFDFQGLVVYYSTDSDFKSYTDSLFLELLASADPLTADALSSLVYVLMNEDDVVGEGSYGRSKIGLFE